MSFDIPTREQLAGDHAEWLDRQREFMKRQNFRRRTGQPLLDDPEGFEADWKLHPERRMR